MISIKKGKWVLNPDVLLNLAQDMEKNQRIMPENRADGVKKFRIPLRSAVSSDVFYEINIEKGPYSGEITITMSGLGGEARVLVYENGRILRWGTWAIELMQTLPAIISREAAGAATLNVEEDADSGQSDALFQLLELELSSNMEERIELGDRGGMPVHLLE